MILGDRYSLDEDATSWASIVATELELDKVVNLSAPGRGFTKAPYRCSEEPCTDFAGTLDDIAAAAPGLVVVFGGAADGRQDITEAATQFFADLRQRLPNARIVAISPITTESQAPAWLVQQRRTIRSAVEAVEGSFVDVGQPGLGDGQELSEQAHDQIARALIEELG